jgi:hypothetical protein
MVSPVRIRFPPLANYLQTAINQKPRNVCEGVCVPAVCQRSESMAIRATIRHAGREATLHSSKVRTANRPFALYKTPISSLHSSTSHRWGR